jgi:serine/threonine-protein kinase RsbW
MPIHIFPGRYDSLEHIAVFIRSEAEKLGFTNSEVFAIETAVDEAVSNIIEHAYKGENIGEISCFCSRTADRLTIVLEDHGQPFDPTSIPLPDLNAPLKKRKDSGLGFFMMNQWMNEVRFEFEPGLNRLIMVKCKDKKENE